MGIIMLTVMLVTLPFMMWAERARKFQQLSPLEQNLRRASHGAAWMAFVPLLAFGVYGVKGVEWFFQTLWNHPEDVGVPAAFFGIVLIYNAIRLIVGLNRLRGCPRDGLLAVRAFVKLSVGAAVIVFFLRIHYDLAARSYDSLAHGVEPSSFDFLWGIAIFLTAFWCLVTGAVRFLLLISGGGNALRLVNRQIQQNTVVWRGARRPQ